MTAVMPKAELMVKEKVIYYLCATVWTVHIAAAIFIVIKSEP